MFNKIILMGRIANDLERKTTPQGLSVCTFRLAVERAYQKAGEEHKADFFNVVVWRQTAEFVTRYFAKGRMILIEGELQTRQYTDKNGNPATWYEIVAGSVSFTGERAEREGYPQPPGYPEPPARYANSSAQAAPTNAESSLASDTADAFANADDDGYPF